MLVRLTALTERETGYGDDRKTLAKAQFQVGYTPNPAEGLMVYSLGHKEELPAAELVVVASTREALLRFLGIGDAGTPDVGDEFELTVKEAR